MLAEQTFGIEENAMPMPFLAGTGSLDAQPGMISRSENCYSLGDLKQRLPVCQLFGSRSFNPWLCVTITSALPREKSHTLYGLQDCGTECT